jgi:hypothetical protein
MRKSLLIYHLTEPFIRSSILEARRVGAFSQLTHHSAATGQWCNEGLIITVMNAVSIAPTDMSPAIGKSDVICKRGMDAANHLLNTYAILMLGGTIRQPLATDELRTLLLTGRR